MFRCIIFLTLGGGFIGRDLTPKERAEYERERKRRTNKAAKLLGISVDELLLIEENSRTELISENKMVLFYFRNKKEEYHKFVERLCDRFEEDITKNEFRRFSERALTNHHEDDVLTIIDRLKSTADSMLKSEKFYKSKKS